MPLQPKTRLGPYQVVSPLGAVAGGLASRSASTGSGAGREFALRRLTELPGLESHPDLSPDGRQLVYSSAAAGNLDVYVMRTDGGRAINITASSPAADEQAAFSPDGGRLVFRSPRDGGGLFLMGATDESVRRLTDSGFDPTWSPDGKRITLIVPGVGLGDADADQLTPREALRTIPLPDSMPGFLLGAWSPSGHLLGGTEVDPSHSALSIGAIEPATRTYHKSSPPVEGEGYPRFAGWLADSRHYVALGRDQIALVDVVTGAWRGLLPSDDSYRSVSLSQDARTLLIEPESVDGDIWLLESPVVQK